MNVDAPEFDFQAHSERAVAKYQRKRPLYEEFSEVTKNVLYEALKVTGTKVHSIEARAKSIDSFGKKAAFQSELDPSKPKYPDPLSQIMDLAGVRTITFFPKTLEDVDRAIRSQFDVIEKTDKADVLLKEGKFGYQSIHYIVRLKPNRTSLPEYERFAGLLAEIQVRTLLQHAWAEIEHDIQYKSVETIPDLIRRRFMSLAGLLEIADREFQEIQNEDERITQQARKSVVEGQLEDVEITPDALKAYLDKTFGSDGRMSEFSYQFTAKTLRRMGFLNFKQIQECIKGFDDDQVNRVLYGTRQGQITRFESLVEAGMGSNYLRRHPWRKYEWFAGACDRHLNGLKAAGISPGSYAPPELEESVDDLS
jgi:putative GTP pyrophosphokinase